MSEEDAPRSTNRKRQCLTCHKVFSNVSHLRRHEASHSRNWTHQCQLCKRDFVRHDALRRHYKTCRQGDEQFRMPMSKRGRRPRACDSCRSRKIQCDAGRPCERCSSDQVQCSYSLINPCEMRHAPERLLESAQMPKGGNKNHPGSRFPLPFLRSYTDPSHDFITDALIAQGIFDVESIEQARSRVTNHEDCILEQDMVNLFSDVPPDLLIYRNMDSDNLQHTTPIIPALETRAEELIAQLSDQYMFTLDPDTFSTSRFSMAAAEAVFTSRNLADYVGAFFSHVHPYFPLIHRPTFDISSVPLPLLLAIFLSGSFHCVPQDDAFSARNFFSLGEEYVFGLLQQSIKNIDLTCGDYSIQVIQAALFMHILGINSNDVRVRHRMRVSRHPLLVASARLFGLSRTKRSECTTAGDWSKFIAEETRIRLVTLLFLLDSMNTLCFNNPPQMTMEEMTGDLPCPIAFFEASTPAEFEHLISAHSIPNLPSLKDWISSLLHETQPATKNSSSLRVDPGHMMISIAALHSLIYTSRTSLLMPSTYESLTKATIRWKHLWDDMCTKCNSEKAFSIGLGKYSLELWWLAQTLLEVTRSNDRRVEFIGGPPTDSLNGLHELIDIYS